MSVRSGIKCVYSLGNGSSRTYDPRYDDGGLMSKKNHKVQERVATNNVPNLIFQISFWLGYFVVWGWLLSKILSR